MIISEQVQQNKALVWEFWQQLNQSRPAEMGQVVRRYVDEAISWHGPHPINDLDGADAVVSGFWEPLRTALPDLRRVCEIFIGGHVHWVGAIGYFSGTFTRDWLGIPATGRELTIRFGEFSAVHQGKIVATYIIPDVLDVIRQAGYQIVPPSRGHEGMVTGPMTGDGVLLAPGDADEGAKTLQTAKVMCQDSSAPTYWDPQRMRWYGPSGIGTSCGLDEYRPNHVYPYRHGLPHYGIVFKGKHIAEIGEGNYAGWVGWPSIRTHLGGEYLGCPPTGRLVEWRLMDFYRREGELLIENWVPVDMLHLFKTMGVDLLRRLREQVGKAD
jgi:predicted ester cyclase